MGTKLAVAVPLPELLDAAREFVRLAAREVAPEHADHRCALEKREIERQAGNVAGSEAHHQQTAAPRDGAERPPAVGPPDRGGDHVPALPARGGLPLPPQSPGGA